MALGVRTLATMPSGNRCARVCLALRSRLTNDSERSDMAYLDKWFVLEMILCLLATVGVAALIVWATG